jgi:guanosine-3',5'-bis(diphosphate) 3'-pyrophosphohydrolase
VQIRTREMHEVAEAGVAAHWSYREGVRAQNPFAVDPAKWIASLTERLDEEDHDEFLENVKLEMYSDQVFCFTPKGDVIQLPRGATPLGLCLCDPHPHRQFLRLGQGRRHPRAAVDPAEERPVGRDHHRRGPAPAGQLDRHRGHRPRQGRDPPVLREEDRGRFVKLGQELARAAFDHVGKKATDKALRTAAKMLGLPDENELLARLGSAELTARGWWKRSIPNWRLPGRRGR